MVEIFRIKIGNNGLISLAEMIANMTLLTSLNLNMVGY